MYDQRIRERGGKVYVLIISRGLLPSNWTSERFASSKFVVAEYTYIHVHAHMSYSLEISCEHARTRLGRGIYLMSAQSYVATFVYRLFL